MRSRVPDCARDSRDPLAVSGEVFRPMHVWAGFLVRQEPQRRLWRELAI